MSRPTAFFTAALTSFDDRSPRRVIMPVRPTSAMVAGPSKRAPFRGVTASDILLLPVLVVKHLIDDLRLDDTAVDLWKLQHLAHAIGAIVDQPHGDTALERGRVVGGRHAALHVALSVGIVARG